MDTYDPMLDTPADVSTVPANFAASLEAIAPNITTLIDDTQAQGESWIDTLARLGTAIVATQQQRELLQVQVERARNGLPPLNASQYGMGVNVGVSPDTQKLIMWGGAALLAALVFVSVNRRRS